MARRRTRPPQNPRSRRRGGRRARAHRTASAGPHAVAPGFDLAAVNEALHVLSRSVAVIAVRLAFTREQRKQVGRRAQLLEGLGLTRDEIAAILGSTSKSVGVLLSRLGKKRVL